MSSGEIVGAGPLDWHDTTEKQAVFFQARAMEDPDQYAFFRSQTQNLDNQTPLLSQEVNIVGGQPGFIIDSNFNPALALVQSDKSHLEATGIYRGYDLCQMYDAKLGGLVLKAVHILQTGVMNVSNPLGNITTETERSLFIVENSIIEPTQPVNAHRHRDIRDDVILQRINQVIFSHGIKPLVKLHAIAQLVNPAILQEPFNDVRHNTRMSYINSLPLLKDLALTASRAIVIERLQDGSIEKTLNVEDTGIRFIPDMFRVSPTYYYDQETGEGGLKPEREVYVDGKVNEEVHVSAALKDIIEVR
jgi:hypothetical protein